MQERIVEEVQITEVEKAVYKVLESLDISYEEHYHKPLFGAEDAEEDGYHWPGLNVKNLVLYDAKEDRFYMVVIEDHIKMDMKKFKRLTGWSKKVSFAKDEQLVELMGVRAGSCSIFGLINDKGKKLTVVLADTIAQANLEEKIHFHPNKNTATVSITVADMFKFLEWTGNKIILDTGENI